MRLLVESFAKTGSGQTQLVAAEKVCRDIHTARGGGGALVQFLVFGVCVCLTERRVSAVLDRRRQARLRVGTVDRAACIALSAVILALKPRGTLDRHVDQGQYHPCGR